MTLRVHLLFLAIVMSTQIQAQIPQTKRVDHTDEYFGVTVSDPYRWLEDDFRNNPEVAEWIQAQNSVTASFLNAIPERSRIRSRLEKLWDFEKVGTPYSVGGRLYFHKNDGLQNQYVLYVQKSRDDEPQVLIDPNKWSEDGTVALSGEAYSPDGRYLTYGVQEAGSDWKLWKVMEIETRTVLEEELRWIKFNSPAWLPNGEGFFYARFPEPVAGAEFQNLNTNQAVYFHQVGTPQSEDRQVFHRPDHPEWGYHCQVSEDGRYLVMTVHVGTDNRYRVFVKDLEKPDEAARILIEHFENEYGFIGNNGTEFYFLTDLDAPRKRVVSINYDEVSSAVDFPEGVKNPKFAVKEIIPEQEATITDVTLIGDRFFVESLQHATTAVAIYEENGNFERTIDFPGIGSASGFSGRRKDKETYYSYSSFNTPPRVYRFDIPTGASELIWQAKVDFQADDYQVSQVFYASKDGTKVPMFIAHKKGIVLDGSNPTLLYGYGGFSIPLTPGFSISRLTWMEMGGVFALANLRGGGEYGDQWHKAGTKLNKQNVFDDFIAAAEWLVANKYTSPKKLAIQGGSNGGLLVGACLLQRPELFGAALPAVGVMDMLRFHRFTAGRYWVDDYGSSDNEEEFKVLLNYSPYHNAKSGCYPATLVTTADTDDRVVPSHSFKFAAALQNAQSCDNPILIRIETKAGHGAGKPTSMIIEELSDQWAFLVRSLEMSLPAKF